MFAWYQRSLIQRPYLTQGLTTAALFALGDGLAQTAIEKRPLSEYDVMRSSRMALYGGAVFGPVATKWYQLLQARVAFRSAGSTLVARVGADQLLFAPTMIGVFLSSMSLLEGKSPADKLSRSYWDALRANWTVWPAVQAVNLFLVPLPFRVLVVNVVNVGWNCFMSLINNAPRGEEQPIGA
ncbi:putative integral membrane protein, Mpv17/PMP22 family [Aspergillus uvarum CBS 121591]|uniref:Putative integral membrane protein, Mpv17/PMP22 family n=1 Tax=Aspergillus uvarum CBS 121591 TaxID=1448315 RepID=A0A319BQ32_9EURO|nr:putative integral membrane protein, Mpv17/PMP22 family [Aspergillus uvarum CBS 121591]PYH75546.1 putative integral membrane protein, Mpv17/PMP22 family [Aspergillus uvarum CBS 121591]